MHLLDTAQFRKHTHTQINTAYLRKELSFLNRLAPLMLLRDPRQSQPLLVKVGRTSICCPFLSSSAPEFRWYGSIIRVQVHFPWLAVSSVQYFSQVAFHGSRHVLNASRKTDQQLLLLRRHEMVHEPKANATYTGTLNALAVQCELVLSSSICQTLWFLI